jgi:hypothetical protein
MSTTVNPFDYIPVPDVVEPNVLNIRGREVAFREIAIDEFARISRKFPNVAAFFEGAPAAVDETELQVAIIATATTAADISDEDFENTCNTIRFGFSRIERQVAANKILSVSMPQNVIVEDEGNEPIAAPKKVAKKAVAKTK